MEKHRGTVSGKDSERNRGNSSKVLRSRIGPQEVVMILEGKQDTTRQLHAERHENEGSLLQHSKDNTHQLGEESGLEVEQRDR